METRKPKILILATLAGGYAGARLYGSGLRRLSRQHLYPASDVPGHVPAGVLLRAFDAASTPSS